MGCFDGYLLLSDIDGTLAIGDNLSAENIRAIRFFQEQGGLFTLATGRPPMYVRHFADRIVPNTYVVAVNGTVLYDLEKDQMIECSVLDEGAVEVIEYVKEHFPHAHVVSTTNSFDRYAVDYALQARMPFAEFAKTMDRPWYKMIVIADSAYSEAYLKELKTRYHGRYQFERSWPEGIEMHSWTSGKDVCIHRLRERLPGIHTVVAAGDYENDMEMLQAADIGYAVGNALPHVKAAADRVTVPCAEHAIARIIEDLYQEANKGGKIWQ